jgi:hypothetical protein
MKRGRSSSPAPPPNRDPPIGIRLTPHERRYFDAARLKEFQDLRLRGMTDYTLSSFMRAAGLAYAKRILGVGVEEFEKDGAKAKD